MATTSTSIHNLDTLIPNRLMEAAGGNTAVLTAFFYRPWSSRIYDPGCSLDEICAYAADKKVDPYPLMKMCLIMGEYRDDLFLLG